MFKDEEDKLNQWKKSIEQSEIPFEKLDQAIQFGFDRASKEKSNRKRRMQRQSILSIATAAVLFFALITSIRVSPAFAQAVASIPGMEKLVELVSNNKGLTAAIENDFFQPVGVTETKDGVSVTVDGIIGDDKEMVLFYTINSNEHDNRYVESVRVYDDQHEDVPYGSLGHSAGPNFVGSYKATIQWLEKIESQKLIFTVRINDNGKILQIDVPFTYVDLGKRGKVYTLNKTVEVKKQKITIESVTINPISTAIKMKFDPDNTMKIFTIEDLRILNQKGETWTSNRDGLLSSGISDDEVIFYLQSNYFDQPKNLYLEFSKIMALEKDQAELVIDTERKEILKQPDDIRYDLIAIDMVEEPEVAKIARFKFKDEKDFNHFPFSEVKDADGKAFSGFSTSQSFDMGDYEEWGLELPDEPYKNPLTYKLTAHPNWIKGNVKIKLK